MVGAGIARLPSYVLPTELADGRLRWLLRDYQTRSMPMYLVHPYQGGLPRRTQVLADYLVDWFKRSGEALEGKQGFGIDPQVLQVGRQPALWVCGYP